MKLTQEIIDKYRKQCFIPRKMALSTGKMRMKL